MKLAALTVSGFCLILTGISACSPAYVEPPKRVLRVPVTYNYALQKDIDAQRIAHQEETSWGRAETKPWNDRFIGENSNFPYQGGVGGNQR